MFRTQIKPKSKVFDTFRLFKALVENISGNTNKVLRNFNGKEYVNKKLQ